MSSGRLAVQVDFRALGLRFGATVGMAFLAGRRTTGGVTGAGGATTAAGFLASATGWGGGFGVAGAGLESLGTKADAAGKLTRFTRTEMGFGRTRTMPDTRKIRTRARWTPATLNMTFR